MFQLLRVRDRVLLSSFLTKSDSVQFYLYVIFKKMRYQLYLYIFAYVLLLMLRKSLIQFTNMLFLKNINNNVG